MALFGSIATIRAQLAHAAHFQPAFAYLDDVLKPGGAGLARILAITAGKTERVELSGGAFALEQAYLTKTRDQGFFESHRAYIDVQVIVKGEELMEVADVAKLTLGEDLTPAKDLLKYQMFGAASVLRLGAGEAAVFFPVDGHMPSLAVTAPALLYKTVVKVPVIR
ncbi:MAG: YhcH/YjgK/YiaL family protein [Nibricoccus sp.]